MLFLLVTIGLFLVAGFVSAATPCQIDASLLSQDPYPAVPGESVKLVFQITGIENPDCGKVSFELLPNFPVSFYPGMNYVVDAVSGTYSSTDYTTSIIAPFKVRIADDALPGDNKISAKIGYQGRSASYSYAIKDFNVTINETKTDFDVIVNSYSFATHTLSLGILNVGKTNAQALTVEIPQQDNVQLSGGNMKIIGSLDSNDDTTASFDALLTGNSIKVKLSYNDPAGIRRTMDKDVFFSLTSFENTKASSSKGAYYYLFYLLVIVLIVVLIYRYFRNRRKKKLALMRR